MTVRWAITMINTYYPGPDGHGVARGGVFFTSLVGIRAPALLDSELFIFPDLGNLNMTSMTVRWTNIIFPDLGLFGLIYL